MLRKFFRMLYNLVYFAFITFVCSENSKDTINIFARSDGNYSVIGLGVKGYSLRSNHPFDTDEENKGLLIAIIHQIKGTHMITPHHFQIWADFQWLRNFFDKIQSGRIVALSLRGELDYRIPPDIRKYLLKMGSFGAQFLGRGVRWLWVFVKGGKTLLESVSYRISSLTVPQTIEGITIIPKSNVKEYCSSWPNSSHWKARRKFCETYESYGDLCSCEDPNVFSSPIQMENNQINSAVVSVVSHRPSLLYESLKSLFLNEGFNKSNLRVFTQTSNPEMENLLRLLLVPLTISDVPSDSSVNSILRQYIYVIKYVLRFHSKEEFFVFLEDDVRYSPDFFIFLNRTSQLLREDPSIYCSSAHNDISYTHTSFEPTAVLRTESYPNCGWMVRKEFLQKMLHLETFSDFNADWDIVTYNYYREGRECVIPEVSRSQHFGTEGAHVNSYKARLHFASKNYNLDPKSLVQNVQLLHKRSYEIILKDLLFKSTALDVSHTPPCSQIFYDFLEHSKHEVIAIYFKLDNLYQFVNNEEYTILAECLNIYSNSAREGHFGLFRLRWKAKHLLLIGTPASKYSIYKPKHIPVMKTNSYLLEAAKRHSTQRIPLENGVFRDYSLYMNLYFH